MRRDLPAGTVTFLFTDIEGSTRLLHELGAQAYAEALAEHRRVLREAFARHGGVEVDTQGDAFFVAFPSAPDAVHAAAEGQEALADGPIRVRMGLHTGEPHLTHEGYVGDVVHEGARIAAVGHGGQVLLSAATVGLSGIEATDLGEHRLKDIDGAVAIFQLGTGRFPPLKTISNTNLPRPVSSFVGRGREIGDVVARLRDGARLVTLSGPGGSGKTRLAIEAASELVPEFKAGVFWVGLAPIQDHRVVLEEVARTLGAEDGLAEHIRDREMLLVLDNLEQVIEAATDLSGVLEACPELRMLVTSRALLRVRGEVEYPVPPLAEPEAVELFCTRSGLPADPTIAELCARLDSLPLPVELAAARTRALTPAQIVERLSQRLDLLQGDRDLDPRQRTLRATIAWSYDLLSPDEQRLFARLSVFAGGCTLDAAEAVADADLDTLQSLVEQSLVRFTNGRYWMLETIRGFALERLEGSGEAEDLRRRHAERYLAIAEEAEPHLRQESIEWLDRIEPEHDNVRAALDTLEEVEPSLGLRLAASVWWFWSLRGHISEGRRRLERVLALEPGPSPARAKALTGAADLAGDGGDDHAVRLLAQEAIALHLTLGDPWGTAYCQLLLGLVSLLADDWSSAQPLLEQSADTFRAIGDEHWVNQVTRRLAWCYEELGDLERAREIHQDLLRRARDSGDGFVEARSLSVLAQFELEDGRVNEGSLAMLEEAHRIHRSRNTHPDAYWDAILLCRFARALVLRDRWATGVRVLKCAEARVEELGVTFEAWVRRMNDETLAIVGDRLDDEESAREREAGRALSPDEAVELALSELRG